MKYPIIETLNETVSKFIERSDSKANRIGENRLGKKHLKALTAGHQQVVAIARYPNGDEVIVDGHSRKAAWKAGSLERPEILVVHVHSITSFKEEGEIIDIYCNTSSVSTPKEKAEQARNRSGLVYTSDLCGSSPWGAAMKDCGFNEDEGYKHFDFALKWLDQFGLTAKGTKRTFSAAVRSSFLESFDEFTGTAKVFWADYVNPQPSIAAVSSLKERVESNTSWGGADKARFRREFMTVIRNMANEKV